MPKKKTGNFDQSRYIQQYMKEKQTIKRVVFNNEYDADLLESVKGENFSALVKRLLRERMEKKQP